jgi:hypothetical protein
MFAAAQPNMSIIKALHVYASSNALGKAQLVLANSDTAGTQRAYPTSMVAVLKGEGAAEFQGILKGNLINDAEEICHKKIYMHSS